MVHLFVLFCLWSLVGVFADTDAVKSVSVLEGDSVTLHSGFTDMMDDDLILWKFGAENTLIAQINVIADSITVYDDFLDERFRNRLQMDDQTGSLTITNTRTTDSGVYQLHTSSMRKCFNLTVNARLPVPVISSNSSSSSRSSKWEHANITDLCQKCADLHGHCCDTAEAVIRLVVTALMGMAAAAVVVILVNDVRSTRGSGLIGQTDLKT
uniref:Immunoglobulin V-set domain-containing protein n=1 Tax=Cyprinus carpio TaxID=7962 RepID=A0A8C1LGI7_CYPCA